MRRSFIGWRNGNCFVLKEKIGIFFQGELGILAYPLSDSLISLLQEEASSLHMMSIGGYELNEPPFHEAPSRAFHRFAETSQQGMRGDLGESAMLQQSRQAIMIAGKLRIPFRMGDDRHNSHHLQFVKELLRMFWYVCRRKFD